MSAPRGDDEAAPQSADGVRATVLAMVGDEQTRALLPRVLSGERLVLVSDLVRGVAFAQSESPDVIFIDLTLGSGAGLAMVHHMKAIAPEASVFALATKSALEEGAHAMALGGAGLLMLPLGGDEVLNAVSLVKGRMAERVARAELMRQVLMSARAAGWVARTAELAEARDRADAARRLADVLIEATGATSALVYFASADHPAEFTRADATPGFERAPAAGSEADVLGFARSSAIVDVPLALRAAVTGHVLLLNPEDAGAGSPQALSSSADLVSASPVHRSALRDGLLKLLATQAAAALTLLYERERLREIAGIKDPTSSAYSFAYYIDAVTREIYRAARFGRRLSIAVASLDPRRSGEGAPGDLAAALLGDHLLQAAPEPSVVGRVDQDEFHVLMPETDGIGAHGCRRRLVAQLEASTGSGRLDPRGVLVGTATFPHDGEDLDQLLRIGRRRAQASAASFLHKLEPNRRSVSDYLVALTRAAAESDGSTEPSAPRRVEISIEEAASLGAAAVTAGLRGGSLFVVVTYRSSPNIFRAVRSAMGGGGPGLTLRVLDVRAAPGALDIEALCVFAEQGTYTLIGENQDGVLRGAHTADPWIADALALELGRAAGVRVFG